jgi:predicted metal-dependent peptidase
MQVKKGDYRIVKKEKSGAGGPIDAPVSGPSNWGSDIKTAEKDSKYEIKKKIKEIVSRSITAGGAKGKLGKKLEDEKEKDANPQINWKKTLMRYISMAEDEATLYKIPSRRYVSSGLYLPGLRGKEEGHGAIVVVIDTSCLICQDPNCNHGMSGQIFGPFLFELRGILKQFTGKNFYIVYSSDGIDGFEELTDPKQKLDRSQMKSTGGNTNSFNPAFKWVEENIFKKGEDLDALVYFTDGFAPPPKKPTWHRKIIWALISTKEMEFGKSLYIPVKGLKDLWDGFNDDYNDPEDAIYK